MNDSDVLIHLDAIDLGPRRFVGTLRRIRRRGSSVISFAFHTEWLQAQQHLVLDPSLALYQGDQYAPDGGLFGIFTDTAPDRWGRSLLQRREAALARREGRRPRSLDEWDFMVGVSDELRTGAVRLVDPDDGHFISSDPVSVPPMTRLRKLEYYAQRAERGDTLQPKEEEEEIALLIAPGSSLGGNRPKANFRAEDGRLWIAKFPSRTDSWDVETWEFVVHELGVAAEIRVPRNRLLVLGEGRRTFASERFDRTAEGRRLFASAMTLLSKRDHDSASYLEIAEAIAQYGDPAAIEADLTQLFRRVAFNVLTGHRDDHLRNHGFLATDRGWRLAPAFDLNPLPNKADHAIAIDEGSHLPDIELVRETAPYYRLKDRNAREILADVNKAVASWRTFAEKAGTHRDEIELMEQVFASRSAA